jgi:hypothetical protein
MQNFVGLLYMITEFISICLLVGNIILLDVLNSDTYCTQFSKLMHVIYLGA